MIKVNEMLEKIIFDEDQLFQLKDLLAQLNAKKIDLKTVKQVILDQRTHIMNGIVDLMSFYLDAEKSEAPSHGSPREVRILQEKIQEREDLLEEIGRRLERIVAHESTK